MCVTSLECDLRTEEVLWTFIRSGDPCGENGEALETRKSRRITPYRIASRWSGPNTCPTLTPKAKLLTPNWL
jgi:hypothetical protein